MGSNGDQPKGIANMFDMKTIILAVLISNMGTNGLQALGITLPSMNMAEVSQTEALEGQAEALEAQELATRQAGQISTLQKLLDDCQIRLTACQKR